MSGAEPPRPIRVLELRSVRGTGGGPEKTILVGSARSDATRFPVLVCYVRDARDRHFDIRHRAQALGVRYVEIIEKHSFDATIWPQLRDLIRSESIDIIHSHDYKSDFLAMLLAKRTGAIQLATVHGWIRNTWRERLYYEVDVRMLAGFPAVIAVSGSIRQTLLDAGGRPDRVLQIPNGVDHRDYRRRPHVRECVRRSLGIPDAKVLIGAIGRLEPEKRLDLLLESAARSRFQPDVLLVGAGSLQADLQRRASERGLRNRVHFLGQRSDVPELLHALDIYVQTSDTEGIPNAVLEAMATEVPVVATHVGGTSEILLHGREGLLIPPGDVSSVVSAIEETLASPEWTRRRVSAARARIVRDLSFDARMAKVEAVYQNLFRRCRSPK